MPSTRKQAQQDASKRSMERVADPDSEEPLGNQERQNRGRVIQRRQQTEPQTQQAFKKSRKRLRDKKQFKRSASLPMFMPDTNSLDIFTAHSLLNKLLDQASIHFRASSLVEVLEEEDVIDLSVAVEGEEESTNDNLPEEEDHHLVELENNGVDANEMVHNPAGDEEQEESASRYVALRSDAEDMDSLNGGGEGDIEGKIPQGIIKEQEAVVYGSSYEFPLLPILFLLRTHPNLIAHGYHERSVISFFFQANADVDTIKEICRMYRVHMPVTASKSDWIYQFRFQPSILTDLCLFGSPQLEPLILLFVVQEFYHDIEKVCGYSNKMPIEMLLDRCFSDIHSDSYLDWDPLCVAMSCTPTYSFFRTIMDAMFEQYPFMSTRNTKDLYTYFGGELRHDGDDRLWKYAFTKCIDLYRTPQLTWPEATLLRRNLTFLVPLMPKLEILQLKSINFEDATTYNDLINALTSLSEPALRTLELPYAAEYVFRHPKRKVNRFLAVMAKRCRCMKRLHLRVISPTFGVDHSSASQSSEDEASSDHETHEHEPTVRNRESVRAHVPLDAHTALVDICSEVLQINSSIERLFLQGIRLPNWTCMSGLFKSATNLTTLSTRGVSSVSQQAGHAPYRQSFDASKCSRLKRLGLKYALTQCPWLKDCLLSQLDRFPRLAKLHISPHKSLGFHAEISEAVANLLRRSKTIEEVSLRNCSVDMDDLSNALAVNVSLKSLDVDSITMDQAQLLAGVLKRTNTSLCSVVLPVTAKDSSAGMELLYYCDLNKFGRSHLRKRSASFSSAITFLSNVTDCNDFNDCNSDIWLRRLSLQFDLLRIDPLFWAMGDNHKQHRSRTPRRKRARPHIANSPRSVLEDIGRNVSVSFKRQKRPIDQEEADKSNPEDKGGFVAAMSVSQNDGVQAEESVNSPHQNRRSSRRVVRSPWRMCPVIGCGRLQCVVHRNVEDVSWYNSANRSKLPC